MELVRLTNPFELFASEKIIRELFAQYYSSQYVEHNENADEAFQRGVQKCMFPDYFFYLIRNDDKFIGFLIGYLLRMPFFTVLYVEKLHAKNKGMHLAQVLVPVRQALGIDEFWGEVPPRVLKAYQKRLPEGSVKTITMVKIRL